ncbi:MAG TPA: hypothetical protein DCZ83_03390 [Candidatus Yonathbacteria bacterium]|nr:hypothetical protein [Candidatus Yonathbacteria bacterium]
MQGFLKIVSTLAIIGIVIIALMFVLDFSTTEEVKETLTKVLLVLGVLALGGVGISFLSKTKE